MTDTRFARSQALHTRACATLSGGVSTAFRVYERPLPLFFASARGATLVDVDGNEYLDYACGFGPVILGHAHPVVAEAVARAAHGLQQIGGQHEAEIELAELLCEHVPAFEVVRPALSGSEAIHAALRLARAATGRSLVVKFAGHYHGWLDGVFAATTHLPPLLPETDGQSASALADVVALEWNDGDALERLFAQHGKRVAALIMEPMPCNGGVIPAAPGFLERARELTREAGAVLVFDEVITGFRVGLGGAQGLLGVTPDLTVVAKAMGNGVPVSAFGGRRELMELVADNRVLHAGTYNGGGISVAAALATIGELAREPIHERLRALGGRLRDGLVEAAAAHGMRLVTAGPGPVFYAWLLEQGEVRTFRDHQRADQARYAQFAEAMLHEGVRVIPAGRWYLNAAHTEEDVERTLEAAGRAFGRIAGSPSP